MRNLASDDFGSGRLERKTRLCLIRCPRWNIWQYLASTDPPPVRDTLPFAVPHIWWEHKLSKEFQPS
jgi:hypothetical protein